AGYTFDAGPSLFTLPELVDELFLLAGKDPSEHFRYSRLETLCHYFFSDGIRLQASADPLKFAADAAAVTGVSQESIVAHLSRSRFAFDATQGVFLQQSLHKAATYLRGSTIWSFLKLPFLKVNQTMNEANEAAFGNQKMVQLFNRFATYNGSDPYQAPGLLNLIPHLEHHLGAYFPEGGMHSITKSIYKLACELGVRFIFGSKATRIHSDRNNRVTGVSCNGTEYQADLVVCNMDIVPAYKQLLPHLPLPKRIATQERSSSALVFYWGIGSTFPELGLHNIFFSADYQREFREIFKEHIIPADPTIYVNISSRMAPEHAPRGKENWFVMINVPPAMGQDWEGMIARVRKVILATLARQLGRDIESLIEAEDTLDPRSIESKTQSFRGSIYGTSSNGIMAAFFRHPNFSPRMKGLYFCGGSVHPGGGIPLALYSAKIVDKLIPRR
ncbi:MAG: phytoene desaturase, partial [Sphingobacteriales bacterium]